MTTGIQASGADLDTLFAARVSTKRADVGWLSNGNVDISNRFEPRGTSTARANTNLQAATADLATLFMDIAAVTFPVTARTCSTLRVAPAVATASWQLDSSGNVWQETTATGGLVDTGEDWVSPTSQASQYSCKATLVSGTNPTTGTMGTVLPLTSTRIWSNARNTVGTFTTTMDVDIIRNSDSAVMKTVRIILTAQCT